jgi:hypothetical protein
MSDQTSERGIDYVKLLQEAKRRVRASPLWRFMEHTPLENDVAVWMADFAIETAEAAQVEGVPPAEPGVPGSEVLCEACAKVFCPHGERLHFHHDGCPACSDDESEPARVPPEPSQEQQ